MSKPTKTIIPVVTIGWSGLWNDGSFGWRTSTFLEHGRPESLEVLQRECGGGTKFYRCRITVTPLKDKRGRYIVKRAKP